MYVRPDEIEFVRAHFNHIELQVGDRALAMRRSLRWIEDQLDPQRFVRVHRSTLVRIDAIRHVQSLGSGRYSIRLETGRSLVAGRGYAPRLLKVLRDGDRA